MSHHLPPSDPTLAEDVPESGSSSSDDDEAFSDWNSDGGENVPCKSLFDNTTLPSVKEARAHDLKEHGFDLQQVAGKLGLDFHGRVRLINWIRATTPKAQDALAITGKEAFLSSDEYLKPVLENDPLLQFDTDEPWSEDDEDDDAATAITGEPKDITSAYKRIRALERRLAQTTAELSAVRAFATSRLDAVAGSDQGDGTLSSDEPVPPQPRDDDSHYFESYGENEIHQIMIQDTVRTSTYANFILRTPQVFQNAIVLDVGCGTGILSLFAARAGAKHVFAVDASPIAQKARAIVAANGLEDVITVIQGKVEDVQLDLPEGHTGVDVIVSEWMGYALLYESMLDSVLRARDRFLRPGGLLAPGQARMKLVLSDGSPVHKDRVQFWSDVYGFDLSVMGESVFTDAAIEVVPESSLLSEPVTIKDIHIPTATVHTLSFSAPFSLVSTSARRTKVRAFVLYFDTFFPDTPDPVQEDEEVQVTRAGEARLAEVWSPRRRVSTSFTAELTSSPEIPMEPTSPMDVKPPLPRKPSLKRPKSETQNPVPPPLSPRLRRQSQGPPKPEPMSSFSTGPRSVPTHWKQTVFLLREPVDVREGTTINGTFFCRKDPENSRDLDVEIHYEVHEPEGNDKGKGNGKGRIVQSYKVR